MIPFFEYRTESVQASSASGCDFPPHLHTGAELVRVRSGVVQVRIGDTEYTVCSGQIAVIFPNTVHAYRTLTDAENTQIDLLICGNEHANGFPERFSRARCENPLHALRALHADVDYMIDAIVHEAQGAKNVRIMNAYFQILWARLLPQIRVTALSEPAVSDLAASLILYVSEHCCEPLTLEMLSKQFGVCRFYLSRTFTKVLHTGFYEYINALRVEHAKKLLLSSSAKILDIAMQCGFQSQQTFNRVFKAACSVTPKEYRSQTASMLK